MYIHFGGSSPAPEGLARPGGLDANLGFQRPCLRSSTDFAHTAERDQRHRKPWQVVGRCSTYTMVQTGRFGARGISPTSPTA